MSVFEKFQNNEPPNESAFYPELDQFCVHRLPKFQSDAPMKSLNSSQRQQMRSPYSRVSLSVPLFPILVVSDSHTFRQALCHLIHGEHYQTSDCSFEVFLSCPQDNVIDLSLVVFDFDHCSVPLSKVFAFLRKTYPKLPVIFLGGHAFVDEMSALGKDKYPDHLIGCLSEFREVCLLPLLHSGLNVYRSLQKEHLISQSVGIPIVPIGFIGDSPVFDKLNEDIRRAAATEGPVFLEGELGTRKEIVAAKIHLQSQRYMNPFEVVQCDVLVREFLEPYLFGLEVGAHEYSPDGYVGKLELFNHGTLYLSHIGHFDRSTQERFLSFLKTRSFYRLNAHKPRICNTRIIASAPPSVKFMVESNAFLPELFEHFSEHIIHVPSFREFSECIPSMVKISLKWTSEAPFGRSCPDISDAAIEKMVNYSWPGNTVEFEQMMKRIVFNCTSGRIEAEDIVFDPPRPHDFVNELVGQPLEEIEKRFILETLRTYQSNRALTAKALKICEKTLYNKLKEYEEKPEREA